MTKYQHNHSNTSDNENVIDSLQTNSAGPSCRLVYGSFKLGETEYALPVNCITDVINAPLHYTSHPLAPDYLKGIVNVRGLMIPVLCLQTLLEIPLPVGDRQKKVAIVQYEGFPIGLIFEDTAEVFARDRAESFHHFKNNNHNVVKGAFKFDGGKRIVQLLDAKALIELRAIPLSLNKSERSKEEVKAKLGARRQCITFRSGDREYAFELDAIQEIVQMREIEDYGMASKLCLGAINLRNMMIPVVDLCTLLELPQSEQTLVCRKLIILYIEKMRIGLLVDEITNIKQFYNDQLLSFPVITTANKNLVKGCLTCGDASSDIIVLNEAEVFCDTELSKITKGHSNLFSEDNDSQSWSKNKDGKFSTYLIFTWAGKRYALGIQEVIEVIEYPEKILKAPGKNLDCVDGLVNLRSELISVVDLSSLLGNKTHVRSDRPHLIVFESKQTKIALVVDHITAISKVFEKDKLKLPGRKEEYLSSCLKEVFCLENNEGRVKEDLIVLDLNRLGELIQNTLGKVA